jgi:PAS domain S-box-containing protein
VSAAEALAELQTLLEELRVSEEEIRVQNEELTGLRESVEADRQRWQDLFDQAPIAYLVTDPLGIVREVNRRALGLFRTQRSFLVGRPLVSYVEERWPFRSRLRRLAEGEAGEWTMRLRPRGGDPVEVLVLASPARDQHNLVAHLRWALYPVPAVPAPAQRQAPAEGRARPRRPAPRWRRLARSRIGTTLPRPCTRPCRRPCRSCGSMGPG